MAPLTGVEAGNPLRTGDATITGFQAAREGRQLVVCSPQARASVAGQETLPPLQTLPIDEARPLASQLLSTLQAERSLVCNVEQSAWEGMPPLSRRCVSEAAQAQNRHKSAHPRVRRGQCPLRTGWHRWHRCDQPGLDQSHRQRTPCKGMLPGDPEAFEASECATTEKKSCPRGQPGIDAVECRSADDLPVQILCFRHGTEP